jgi:hypothetical protein
MRGIRGWIRNLSDGVGPPPGSVKVHATVAPDQSEIDLEDDQTGALEMVHLTGGSGSTTFADSLGHFGWNFEQSPGQIKVQVIPEFDTDHPEYRWRFPDESAQIGKAFHTDLERLAWTAGRDGVVWNAIHGTDDPPTPGAWSQDPVSSSAYGQGNFSIAGFGSGGDAMKVTLRRGIGFVGGTVFSVESGNLVVPVAGETPLATNPSGSQRWDLLLMKVNIDPISPEYGKQSFELIAGTPGGGIPEHPGQVAGYRRLALHALGVNGGAGVYSAAFDLRRWLWHPALSPQSKVYASNGFQTISSEAYSTLNTSMDFDEFLLPMGCGWAGMAHYTAFTAKTESAVGANRLGVKLITQGRSVLGEADGMAGSDYALKNPTTGDDGFWFSGPAAVYPIQESAAFPWHEMSVAIPITVIPPYHQDSGVSAVGRRWHRMRMVLRVFSGAVPLTLAHQSLSVQLWPVP